MISTASLVGMVFSLALSFLFPLILAIYFIRKYKTGILAFVTGAAVFILFALILEQFVHFLIIGPNSPIAETIKASPFLMGMYGGFMAGIFEETGRLLAFMFILKKARDWSHGVVYGIGHGGIESWILVSLTYVSNLMLSMMANAGQLEAMKATLPPDQIEVLDHGIQTLATTDPALFFIAGIERVLTVIIQIGLSLLVLYAIRKRKYLYFGLAILLHAALDFFAVFINTTWGNIYISELVVAAFAAGSIVWIIKSKALMAPEDSIQAMPVIAEPQ
jgi:uncharacterized membrane protein YhfC